MSETLAVGIGISSRRELPLAVKEAVAQAKGELFDRSVDLGILFSTVEYARPSVLQGISELISPAPLIGASSAAIFSPQGVLKQGVALLLLSFPSKTHFNVAAVEHIRNSTGIRAGGELGERLLHGFKESPRIFSLLFSDGLNEEVPSLLAGLQQQLGTSFPIMGASASDNLGLRQTYVYYNQEILSDASCGIVLAGKLNMGFGIKHGLKPLGKPRTVTRSVGNTVYEIDGKSATNVYEEYLSSNLRQLKVDAKRISILYPIGIYLPSEQEYLIRNILSIENNGSLIFQGNVPEGSTLRLMIGTKSSSFEATKDAVSQVKKHLDGAPPKCIMVFESASRLMLLGRSVQKELDILREGFGAQVPIIGMCSYGEQAPLPSPDHKGQSYMHNQTMSVLAFGG